MKVAQRKPSRCTSIQKVTAALLLSFLTFSSPASVWAADKVEQNEAQHILPLPAPRDNTVRSHIEPDVHRFVCLI
jgi:hypothetical protein